MEQHTGSQYDDDLTVGMDEYDDSFQTGNVDLFEFVSDEESPITRLKTIILSIDWEITDDILRQFNMELLDLKDIWADEKINLVYIQALEKISKYIYKEKANSNPNAIKLLLQFYSNLEKIVSTESMPDEEKKRLLIEDVEKFEKFKKQISRSPGDTEPKKTTAGASFTTTPTVQQDDPLPTEEENDDPLLNLKAIVFGMDWEITEADLINLGEEVRNLEKRFSNSKARLIFLQGIGALGAYINLKRSNAHVDAFKLLHSFFLSLENIVRHNLTGEEEKRILMPEVEKFNAFKSVIAATISPEAIAAEGEADDEDLSLGYPSADDEISPAFADMPEDIRGFQEEEEAESLGYEAKQKVDGQIDRFFDSEITLAEEDAGDVKTVEGKKSALIDEMESRLDGFFGEDSTLPQIGGTSQEVALQGVDVETEADDDTGEEELLRFGDEPAPALAEIFEESSFAEKTIAVESGGTESSSNIATQFTGSVMDASGETQTFEDISDVLQGVEVETEADDDSEEEPLPLKGEELAPALFALDDETEDGAEKDLFQEEAAFAIDGRLEEFFGDEPLPVVDEQVALQGVNIGTEDEEEVPAGDFLLDEDGAPALFSVEEDEEEDVIKHGVLQEEKQSEMVDFSEASLAEDTEQVAGPPVIEDASDDLDVEAAVVDFDDEIEHAALQSSEQAALLSGDEGSFVVTLEEEQESLEDQIPADIEDHLKEFFETGAEELEIKEEPEKALFAAEEAEEPEEALFAAEEAEEPEEALFAAEEAEEPEEALFAAEEAEEPEEALFAAEEAEEPEEEALFAAEETEEPEEALFAAEEAEEPEEALFAAEETEEPEEALFAAEETEEPEEALFAAEETEEPEEALFASEEPVFTALKDEPVETFSVLQEDEDFIEYIEGVEFDSEEETPETVFEPVGKTEEVVFEAADEGSLSERESEEQVFFDEVEEELDKYFTEHDGDKRGDETVEPDEEYFGSPNIFGERLDENQGLIGSEIRMEVFPETPKAEEVYVFEEVTDSFAEDVGLSQEVVTEKGEAFYTGSELSSMKDDDPLSSLRNCVASLGREISDATLESLFDEINKLNKLWTLKPVEKIFLQLLSTVAEHIHDYRHQASPEAHSLLMSVFNKLEISSLAGVEIMEVQEDLLSETSKILLWQQKMISRKTAEQGDELVPVFEGAADDTEIDDFKPGLFFEHDRLGKGVSQEDGERGEHGSAPDVKSEPSADALDAEKISRIVRVELETLRQSFRTEMADLLRQHLDKGPSDGNGQ